MFLFFVRIAVGLLLAAEAYVAASGDFIFALIIGAQIGVLWHVHEDDDA